MSTDRFRRSLASQGRASAEVIPFPLARRWRLVHELADRFLIIPPGPRRMVRFGRVLGWATRDLRKLGVSAERADREIEPLKAAIAAEVRRLLCEDDQEGGAA